MKTINANKNGGGIGLGGVAYDANNVAQAAHMLQPTAIGLNPYKNQAGAQQQDIQAYDPYYGQPYNFKLMWDTDGRMYINLWGKRYPQMFHLEELYTLENMGPTFCAARNNGGAATTKPGTPVNANGPTTGGNNGLNVNPVTPTPAVKGPITPRPVGCPNGRIEPGEECDDGNNIDIDDCSNSCKLTTCGDGIVQLLSSRKEVCEPPNGQPNSMCRVGSYWGSCLSNCKCGPPPVPLS